MGCDCHSYNREVGTVPAVVLMPPPAVAAFRSNPAAGISIDACIAPAVQAVWDAGYITIGSCCGHNGRVLDGVPALVIDNNERDYSGIRAAVATVDARPFKLLQWQLVDIDHE